MCAVRDSCSSEHGVEVVEAFPHHKERVSAAEVTVVKGDWTLLFWQCSVCWTFCRKAGCDERGRSLIYFWVDGERGCGWSNLFIVLNTWPRLLDEDDRCVAGISRDVRWQSPDERSFHSHETIVILKKWWHEFTSFWWIFCIHVYVWERDHRVCEKVWLQDLSRVLCGAEGNNIG